MRPFLAASLVPATTKVDQNFPQLTTIATSIAASCSTPAPSSSSSCNQTSELNPVGKTSREPSVAGRRHDRMNSSRWSLQDCVTPCSRYRTPSSHGRCPYARSIDEQVDNANSFWSRLRDHVLEVHSSLSETSEARRLRAYRRSADQQRHDRADLQTGFGRVGGSSAHRFLQKPSLPRL